MGQNVTFLGDVADDFDKSEAKSEAVLDVWVENRGYSTGSMVAASAAVAFMRFSATFVDILRLGNGLRDGGFRGVGTDAIRLLTVAGAAGSAVSRLTRILVVEQAAGTFTCTWITTVNALGRTGQRFFASIEQLAQAAGVDLKLIAAARGTPLSAFKALIDAVRKVGVVVEDVKPSSQQVESIVDLMNARANGALAFAIEYTSGAGKAGHQLFATYSKICGLAITDTTGVVYRSFGALLKAYPNARLYTEYMFFLKNAAIIDGAANAATIGGLGHLVVQLIPVVFKSQSESWTPPTYHRPPGYPG
jgi:hypothetical protein